MCCPPGDRLTDLEGIQESVVLHDDEDKTNKPWFLPFSGGIWTFLCLVIFHYCQHLSHMGVLSVSFNFSFPYI